MIHLNSYTHEHLLNVSEVLQTFFHGYDKPFVSDKAIVGVHRAVLHACTVFDVGDGIRQYIAAMQTREWGERASIEELIRRRIAEIEAEQSPEGYPADWALRGLAVIMRDAPLTPYRADRSLLRKIIDHYRGVPTPYQLREHEEALLEPIGRNLTEIVLEYYRAQRRDAA